MANTVKRSNDQATGLRKVGFWHKSGHPIAVSKGKQFFYLVMPDGERRLKIRSEAMSEASKAVKKRYRTSKKDA